MDFHTNDRLKDFVGISSSYNFHSVTSFNDSQSFTIHWPSVAFLSKSLYGFSKGDSDFGG